MDWFERSRRNKEGVVVFIFFYFQKKKGYQYVHKGTTCCVTFYFTGIAYTQLKFYGSKKGKVKNTGLVKDSIKWFSLHIIFLLYITFFLNLILFLHSNHPERANCKDVVVVEKSVHKY